MLRIFFLLLLTSCTLGSSKYGGKRAYQYQADYLYQSEELMSLSRDTIISYKRNPRQMKWEEAFTKKHPIKAVSTFSFETIIQPTRSGVAGWDKVYLSPKGKQILTDKLLNIWEDVFVALIGPQMEYLPMKDLYKNKEGLHIKYGSSVKDYGGRFQEGLEGDDIFVKEKGKSLSSLALFQPSFSRDLSLLLVPGHQLFGGPRGNNFQKYYLAELMDEFKLNALYSIITEIDWQSSRVDKITQKSLHQKAIIKFKLTPMLSYKYLALRLKELGRDVPSDLPNLNFASYEGALEIPVDLNSLSSSSTVEEIDAVLLRPILKSYTDMCVMMAERVSEDFKKMKIK